MLVQIQASEKLIQWFLSVQVKISHVNENLLKTWSFLKSAVS